ncbi:hypothetical protein [Streptomyces sp. NPDC059371]|uniref:hypothetical protein n=1 Tax=Streptomyces sp. NPDC059371 TaxID=3346812 RepID=UPI0036A8C143
MAPLELGNPLQLTKSMRARLLAAVRALAASPALEGASDGARLASVVLTAKANVRNDYRTSIWAAELGRWLGLSQSTVAHTVLPELRRAGVLGSIVATNALGHTTGLECWVIPMYRAQKAGDRRHTLALSRSELAVLLRLLEVLFGPGWAPRGRPPVPAGRLAERTGPGAATDRLGLLLMVLTTGSSGWLQLCSGPVETGRGRPAATVARLLGLKPAGGAKVLARLRKLGVAEVVRQGTGSGMHAKSRVRLVPVAEAYGRIVEEAREAASSLLSDLSGTASGDLEIGETPKSPVVAGDSSRGESENAESADLAAPAQHHASHASVAAHSGSAELSGGFSGEARRGEGDLPEHAGARKDRPAHDGKTVVLPMLPQAEVGPLRGEKPKDSPVDAQGGPRIAGDCAGSRSKIAGGGKPQPQRRGGLPDDLRLRVALRPVAGLWARLSGWQRDQVQAATTRELTQLAGLLVEPDTAPQLLADRLTDRLQETRGEALVNSPYGWLIRRGLVQRQACPDLRCDDAIRLDTGGDCDTCGNVIHLRRAHRARIAAKIDEELPGIGERERRQVLEERLRDTAAHEAENRASRRAQVRDEQARRDAGRTAAREQAEREHQAAAAVEAARHALPCENCGLPEAAGLCPACAYRRRAETLVREAVDLAVSVRADLADTAAVGELIQQCDRDTRALLEAACESACGNDADPGLLAYTTQQVARRIRDERRQSALHRLKRSEQARAEADTVYQTYRRRHGHRTKQDAEQAAELAGQRTADALLGQLLSQLDTVRKHERATFPDGGRRCRA